MKMAVGAIRAGLCMGVLRDWANTKTRAAPDPGPQAVLQKVQWTF